MGMGAKPEVPASWFLICNIGTQGKIHAVNQPLRLHDQAQRAKYGLIEKAQEVYFAELF